MNHVHAEENNPYFRILKTVEAKEGSLITVLIKDYKTEEISRIEEFDLNNGNYLASVYDMKGTLLNELTRVNRVATLKDKGEIVERFAITPFTWGFMAWNYRCFKQSDVDLADRIVITLSAYYLRCSGKFCS